MGYLPEMLPMYTDMTTPAYLALRGPPARVERRAVRGRVDEVMVQCALDEYYRVLLAKLSRVFRNPGGKSGSLGDTDGVEIKATEMKVDGVAESLAVAEPAR